MENTAKVLIGEDKSAWYVAMGERSVGPLTASDVYAKLATQEITWAHYVWKQGLSKWARLCEVQPFKAAVPEQPKTSRPPAAPSQARTPERIWFIYRNETQYGPFAEDEVKRFYEAGQVSADVYAWRNGMKGWELLAKIKEFGLKVAVTPAERRKAPRAPLVAKVILAKKDDADTLAVAVCRDVSVGGMQVLTDRVPGPVGAKIKLNVSMPHAKASQRPSIQAFVAEGVIVRILEDGRGFSFRFDRLSNDAKNAIEQYIA